MLVTPKGKIDITEQLNIEIQEALYSALEKFCDRSGNNLSWLSYNGFEIKVNEYGVDMKWDFSARLNHKCEFKELE